MEREIPKKFTNEELAMAMIFSKNRSLFVPEATGRLFYFFLVSTARAGVGLQKGAGKLAPKL